MIALIALVPAAIGGCRRKDAARRAGLCATHTDCDPGYDCATGKCTKRPPAPTESTAAAEPAAVAPPPPAPREQSAAPPIAPATRAPSTPAPARPAAPGPVEAPARPAPPPPPSELPLWKQRLKNS